MIYDFNLPYYADDKSEIDTDELRSISIEMIRPVKV